MQPTLLITVDTEEEGLWGGRFPVHGNTVKNLRGIPRFQQFCEQFGVRPTYLVDAPVVMDDDASDLLRGLHQQRRAEIGAHLHPWCNPPLDEAADRRSSYQCNLPAAVQREKLVWLTETIEKRIGHRPTSFRAGRYGLDIVGAKILRDLGYVVDSSVIPFTDYSSDAGPNFEHAPYRPYFVDGDDLCQPHSMGWLLEVPVSVGFHRGRFARSHALLRAARQRWLRRLHAVGLLDRLGIVRRIKFSPEQSDARRMCQLADALLANQVPAVVMLLHSTSLVVGGSPYVRDRDGLERIYTRMNQVIEHCLIRRRMATATLTGFAHTYFNGETSTT